MSARLVRRSAGFTLVEVLVAMSIMAIVAIMSWQGVDGIVRARAASQDKLEQLLRVNTVLAQWEQDLNSLQDSNGAVPALEFDGGKLTLTRRTPSGLQLVVWSLRNSTFLRWASPSVTTTRALQEHWLASQQFLGNEAGQLRALPGVSQLQMYATYDNDDGAWSNMQSSGDTAMNGTGSQQGKGRPAKDPRGVRLVLTFSGDHGNTGSITRDIAIRQ